MVQASTPEEVRCNNGANSDTIVKPDRNEEDSPMYTNGAVSGKEQFRQRKRSSKHLNRRKRVLLGFTLATCVLSTVLTISVCVKMNFKHGNLQEPIEATVRTFQHHVCVQCARLVRNPFNHLAADPLIDKLVKRLDDGFQMCCAENEEQMSALVEAIMREQVTEPIPSSNNMDTSLKFVPVSAHKQLLSGDDREFNVTEPYYGNGTDHFVVRFNPKYNDPLTEHANGVAVLETALQILYSGVYYIYFSVNLAPRFHHNPRQSVQDWSQYVHRRRDNSPATSGVLLQVSHSPCSDCRQHQESAFAGGTFTLKKNDLIQVCLTGLGLVQYRKESSYLGIILLSNTPTDK